MALPLIPMLLAGEVADTAWGLGRAGLRELLSRDQVGRLLVILYNDYGDASGLSKSKFYALADEPELRSELDLVVAGRRTTSDEDVTVLAQLLEPYLAASEDGLELAKRIAFDGIAVASFASQSPREILRYLVATTEEIEAALGELKDDTEKLLEGQARIEEQIADTQQLMGTMSAPASQHEVVRFVQTDWGPEGARLALRTLGRTDPTTLERLQATVGDPPSRVALQEMLDESPGWFRGARPEALIVVAIFCQQFGLWSKAADVWYLAASAADAGVPRAELLTRTAIAREISGDTGQYLELLERARTEDPDAPRLRLEEATNLRDPDEQLAALEALASDDAELEALIEAQRALALLLKADCEGARRHLELARAQASWMRQLDGIDVNITVQEARIAVSRDRAVNVEALTRASTAAEQLRDELLANKRFEEGGRILMLLCDTRMLLGEIDNARDLVKDAQPEELSAGENAEVLAEVALRISQYRLALQCLEGYGDTPGSIRQRACALMHTGSSQAVIESLRTLHDLALADTLESEMAGANLILGFAEEPRLEWDEEVAQKLIELGHERMVIGARARQLAAKKYYEDAEKLLEPYKSEIWALEAILFTEVTRRRPKAQIDAANALLAAGPDPSMALICAKVVATGADKQRAVQVAVNIARSPGASVKDRSDSYHLVLALLANDLGDWTRIPSLWDEWQELAPDDPRLPAWYARILGHSTTDGNTANG